MALFCSAYQSLIICIFHLYYPFCYLHRHLSLSEQFFWVTTHSWERLAVNNMHAAWRSSEDRAGCRSASDRHTGRHVTAHAYLTRTDPQLAKHVDAENDCDVFLNCDGICVYHYGFVLGSSFGCTSTKSHVICGSPFRTSWSRSRMSETWGCTPLTWPSTSALVVVVEYFYLMPCQHLRLFSWQKLFKKYKYNKYNKNQQTNKQVILHKMFYINIKISNALQPHRSP